MVSLIAKEFFWNGPTSRCVTGFAEIGSPSASPPCIPSPRRHPGLRYSCTAASSSSAAAAATPSHTPPPPPPPAAAPSRAVPRRRRSCGRAASFTRSRTTNQLVQFHLNCTKAVHKLRVITYSPGTPPHTLSDSARCCSLAIKSDCFPVQKNLKSYDSYRTSWGFPSKILVSFLNAVQDPSDLVFSPLPASLDGRWHRLTASSSTHRCASATCCLWLTLMAPQ
jgi:hypothetical protein